MKIGAGMTLFVAIIVAVDRSEFSICDLSSAICNLDLSGFTRRDFLDEFLLSCWRQFLFDHPVFLDKGILSLDEEPFLSGPSSSHQNE